MTVNFGISKESDILNDYIVGMYNKQSLSTSINKYNRECLIKANELIEKYFAIYILSKSLLNIVESYSIKHSELDRLRSMTRSQCVIIDTNIKLRQSLKKHCLQYSQIIKAVNNKINSFSRVYEKESKMVYEIVDNLNLSEVIKTYENIIGQPLINYIPTLLYSYDINLYTIDVKSKYITDIIDNIHNELINVANNNGLNIKENLKHIKVIDLKQKQRNDTIIDRNKKIDENMNIAVDTLYNTLLWYDNLAFIYSIIEMNQSIAYLAAQSDGYSVSFLYGKSKGTRNISRAKVFRTYEEAQLEINRYLENAKENRYRYAKVVEIDINKLRKIYNI